MKTADKASILITRERSTKLGKKQGVILFNSKLYEFNRI